MPRLIDADALIEYMGARVFDLREMYGGYDHYTDGFEAALGIAENAPTIDAVPVGVLDQVRWERDVAIAQLNDYGVSFGEKADCVRVTRCKDCKHWDWLLMECKNDSVSTDNEGGASYSLNFYLDDFCSYGEKRDEEDKSEC